MIGGRHFYFKNWFISCGCMLCFKIYLKVYLGIPFSYLSYNQHCDGLDECEDKNLTQGCHFHFLIDLPTVAVSSIHLFWSTFSSTFDYHCLFPCSRLVFNLKTFPKLSKYGNFPSLWRGWIKRGQNLYGAVFRRVIANIWVLFSKESHLLLLNGNYSSWAVEMPDCQK